MERLPYELRERVFKLLQLGDLAACRRVSRGLQQLVDEYLQTIQHVDALSSILGRTKVKRCLTTFIHWLANICALFLTPSKGLILVDSFHSFQITPLN